LARNHSSPLVAAGLIQFPTPRYRFGRFPVSRPLSIVHDATIVHRGLEVSRFLSSLGTSVRLELIPSYPFFMEANAYLEGESTCAFFPFLEKEPLDCVARGCLHPSFYVILHAVSAVSGLASELMYGFLLWAAPYVAKNLSPCFCPTARAVIFLAFFPLVDLVLVFMWSNLMMLSF